ncbi:MAG: DUF1186 domain-containing protein [Candidatus Babeliales bacterium]
MDNQITNELEQLLNDLFTQTKESLNPHDIDLIAKHSHELSQRLLPVVQLHLDQFAAGTHEEGQSTSDFYWSIVLLARLEEPLLFPSMIKICSMPEDQIDDVLGIDFITEELPFVLALTCNGRWALLQPIIENNDLDLYIRNACLDACMLMTVLGTMQRKNVVVYLKKLLQGCLESVDGNKEWNAFVITTCCDLHPEECMEEIKELFGSWLVDTSMIRIDDVFDDQQKKQQECTDALKRKIDRFFALHTQKNSTEIWTDNKEHKKFEEILQDHEQRARTIELFLLDRQKNKIGRNDQCFCLSGKKYKKCCIAKPDIPKTVVMETSSISFEPRPLPNFSDEETERMQELFFMMQDDPVRAVAAIKDFLVTHQDVPAIYNYLFAAQTKCGKHREAIGTLKTTAEKFPTYLFGTAEYGLYFLRRGEPEHAHKLLKGAQTLNQLYPERQTFHVTELKAFCYFMGMYCVAIKDFKQMKMYTSLLKELPDGAEGAADIIEGARTKLLRMNAEELPNYTNS